MKVGRNSPCPCGSGKKFKQCCGRASVAAGKRAGDTLASVQGLLQQGRHGEAEAACARMMAAGQGGSQIVRLRADLLAGAGQTQAALALYQQVLEQYSKDPVVLYNAGTCAMNLGQFEQAASLLAQAHRLQPDEVETQENLGIALAQSGRFEEAVRVFTVLLERHPQHHSARLNLVNALTVAGRLDQAVGHLQQVLDVHPKLPQALAAKGLVALRQGKFERARVAFDPLVKQAPGDQQLLDNLEAACSGASDWPAVIRLLEQRGAATSSDQNLRCRLAKAWAYAGDLQAAQGLLEGLPESALVQRTYALCYREFGMVEAVVRHLQAVLKFDPQDLRAHESLLMMHQYLPDQDEAVLVDLARNYGSRLPTQSRSYDAMLPIKKSVRIGFVSADLRQHSVGYFMLPLLQHIDRSKIEVYVYDNNASPDAMTAQMRKEVECWRHIDALNDQQAANLIREDTVQVLIDLSGLTLGNRLGVFALAPAPVQVTWLGYPATTGVPHVDYRLTDAVTDPVGMTERHYTEKLWRLPNLFSVYSPPQSAPAVSALPMLENGHVTFGSFNNFNKLNRKVLKLWAELLGQVEGSRLLLKAKALRQAKVRDQIEQIFLAEGVHASRLSLLPSDASLETHLARYGEVDIALDSFPYSGTTTTCEALWMGVPVLTLAGETHRSRVGLAQLKAVGLDDWVAGNCDEYLAKARTFVEDVSALKTLRARLRSQMRASSLTDAEAFAADFTQALFEMAQAGSGSP